MNEVAKEIIEHAYAVFRYYLNLLRVCNYINYIIQLV